MPMMINVFRPRVRGPSMRFLDSIVMWMMMTNLTIYRINPLKPVFRYGGAKTIVGPIRTTTRGIGNRANQTVSVRRGGRSTSRATVSAHKTQILKPVAQDAPNLHKVCQP